MNRNGLCYVFFSLFILCWQTNFGTGTANIVCMYQVHTYSKQTNKHSHTRHKWNDIYIGIGFSARMRENRLRYVDDGTVEQWFLKRKRDGIERNGISAAY